MGEICVRGSGGVWFVLFSDQCGSDLFRSRGIMPLAAPFFVRVAIIMSETRSFAALKRLAGL
jgi:hypothetical protein